MQALTNLRNELITACKDEALPKTRRELSLECLDLLDLGLSQIANHNYTPDGLDIVDLMPSMTADEQREIHLFVKVQAKWYVRPAFLDSNIETKSPSLIPPSIVPSESETPDFRFED
jgi:hypothetical protein